MLDSLVAALRVRSDLQAWSIKHRIENGAQLYAVPGGVEAVRLVSHDQYTVEVLRDTTGSEGTRACGTATITLVPGDDIDHAIDEAVFMASLVQNPPYTFPDPKAYPEVVLSDPELLADKAGALDQLYTRLRNAVDPLPNIRLTAAEFFGSEITTHLVTSCGIDARQVSSQLELEWVLIAQVGEQEKEMFVELTRRRAADVDIEEEVKQHSHWALDLLQAQAAPDYTGPVVLRSATLANFMGGDSVFQVRNLFATLGSARSKYGKLSQWEVGKSIFRTEVQGDPLTLWANRQLPYGTASDRFDDEGLPAQRVLLIKDNQLANFVASQRYATYLSLPVTGAFGNLELSAGQTTEADLLAEPYLEVVAFSWFNPNPITGEFATEIRLGYVVDGDERTPFRGGMLVGNVLDALANVRWSRETGFYGHYQGPRVARFQSLTVAGSKSP